MVVVVSKRPAAGGRSILGPCFGGTCAAAEMAFASVNRARLRQVIASRHSREQLAEALLAEPARLLSTLLVVKLLGGAAVIACDDSPGCFYWVVDGCPGC